MAIRTLTEFLEALKAGRRARGLDDSLITELQETPDSSGTMRYGVIFRPRRSRPKNDNKKEISMTDIPSELSTKEQTEEQKAKAERMKQKYAQILGAHLIHFSPEEEASLTAYEKSDERIRIEAERKIEASLQSGPTDQAIRIEHKPSLKIGSPRGRKRLYQNEAKHTQASEHNADSLLNKFIRWVKS